MNMIYLNNVLNSFYWKTNKQKKINKQNNNIIIKYLVEGFLSKKL